MPPATIPKLMILAAALLFTLHAPPVYADADVSVTQGYIKIGRAHV